MNILTVHRIFKRYKAVRALQDISLVVPEGCIYGILGPNGSGKTTLLGIITDVLVADSGDYELFEDKVTPKKDLRKKIGTLLETPNFYHYLSAYENLRISAEIKGVSIAEISEVLKKVGLYERKDSKFSTFSLGMKQRLGIAAALLGNPALLVLDEPTNGLDPEGIAEIRELIKKLGAGGHTIIMASHLLDEVEKVCTHVAVLKGGTLLAAGKSDEILAEGDIVELSANDIEGLHALLKELYPNLTASRNGDIFTLVFEVHGVDVEKINSACFTHGIVLTRLVLKKKSLESIFLELITNSENRA